MPGQLRGDVRARGPVRARSWGVPPPGAPRLVVVPGLGALGYLRPTVEACAAWTGVSLLDLPGFGRLDTALRPADVATTAEALVGWLDGAPRPVVLVGHSTGAQIALRAAVARPDAVDRLVLAGVTFPPQARTLPAVLARALRTLPAEALGEVPAVLPYYLRGLVRLPELLRSALADRPEDLLPRVRPPVLVLRGRRDALCPPAWAQRLADLAPDGRLATVPGGHNCVWTFPADVSAALRDFVG